jgi:hypothetical protein
MAKKFLDMHLKKGFCVLCFEREENENACGDQPHDHNHNRLRA